MNLVMQVCRPFKSMGIDNLSSEHLKNAGDMLPHLLSILFTNMFMHGYMPPEVIKSVTVPFVKSKMKSDKSNYRQVTWQQLYLGYLKRLFLLE